MTHIITTMPCSRLRWLADDARDVPETTAGAVGRENAGLTASAGLTRGDGALYI